MSLSSRRALAFAVDWCVVALWGAILFAAVMLFSGGDPPSPGGPWRGQLVGLLTMTLPAVLYFGLTEASRARASLGKRVLGLQVRGELDARLSPARSLLRNALKFLPWECGHLVAQQLIHAGESPAPAWLYLPMAVSLLGPVWWIATIVASGRTPYDRAAGAWVLRAG